MKKVVIIVIIVIVLVVGWFVFFGSKKAVSPTTSSDNVQTTVQESVVPQTAEKDVISSIKDAMGLGKKMKCTYAVSEGGIASTVFIDGQKYKFTSEANGQKMYGLFDGETQYTWTTGTEKTGFKMTKACIDELSKTTEQSTTNTQTTTPQDMQASFDTAKNVECEAAESEDFSLPTDINFVDQCAMIRESTKTLESIKSQLPAGVNIPGY